jgi:hypothetical protein
LGSVAAGLTNPEALKAAAKPGIMGLMGLYGLGAEPYKGIPAGEASDPENPWKMSLTALQPPGNYFRDREAAWRKKLGLALLMGGRGYQAGGFVSGPGGPRSDSVPAVIDGRTPARLSTGEFVLPADVVQRMGGGSPQAGAMQLQRMMSMMRGGR